MPKMFFDEQKFVEDNIELYEKRLSSKWIKYQEGGPTYVTYYHLVTEESICDGGFENVESILGDRSPIRFHKIENLPIYGFQMVVPEKEIDEEGVNISFNSDAIILPNTIRPVEYSFFVVNHLGTHYIFRVTDIEFDSIKDDRLYNIKFNLEYTDYEGKYLERLEKQSTENNICVIDNMGEKACIIESGIYQTLDILHDTYNIISDIYLKLFYNKRHNSIIYSGEDLPYRLYDPYQTKFINQHNLFNDKQTIFVTRLTPQLCKHQTFELEYAKTIYYAVELREKNLITGSFEFFAGNPSDVHSTFYKWHEKDIKVVKYYHMQNEYKLRLLTHEFVESLRNPEEELETNEYARLLRDFILNKEINITEINYEELKSELLDFNNSFEIWYLVPIILYILRELENDILGKK